MTEVALPSCTILVIHTRDAAAEAVLILQAGRSYVWFDGGCNRQCHPATSRSSVNSNIYTRDQQSHLHAVLLEQRNVLMEHAKQQPDLRRSMQARHKQKQLAHLHAVLLEQLNVFMEHGKQQPDAAIKLSISTQ
jgi:predicted DCC family thiol-disulfide oxidoreductase YuxK